MKKIYFLICFFSSANLCMEESFKRKSLSDIEEEINQTEKEIAELKKANKKKTRRKQIIRDQQTLLAYIRKENPSKIEKWHAKYLFQWKKDLRGRNLLHWAIKNNDYQAFQDLVNIIDISKPTNSNKTALHYAVLNKNIEMVKILIDKGADPFYKTREGFDSFILARKIKKFLSERHETEFLHDMKHIYLYLKINCLNEEDKKNLTNKDDEIEGTYQTFDTEKEKSGSLIPEEENPKNLIVDLEKKSESIMQEVLEKSAEPVTLDQNRKNNFDLIHFNLLDNNKSEDLLEVAEPLPKVRKVVSIINKGQGSFNSKINNVQKISQSLLKNPKKAILSFCCFSVLTYFIYKVISRKFESKEEIKNL